MQRGGHQISNGIIHKPVLRYRRQTSELFGHDSHRIVPPAALCARVAGMQVAVIGQFEHFWRKRGRQSFAQRVCNGMFGRCGCSAHSCAAGLATSVSSTFICREMYTATITVNTSSAPVMPKVRQVTQVSVE